MVLDKFEYSDCSSVSTLFDPIVQLVKGTSNPVNQKRYAQIISTLMYLTNRTRPNIAYVISRLSKYTSNPSMTHCIALERVFHYLKRTLSYTLKFIGCLAVIE